MMKRIILFLIALIPALASCQDDDSESTVTDPDENIRAGFEIVQFASFDSLLVWINDEPLTQEEFNDIQLDAQWFKNEPRESDPDSGFFYRSPNASEDGQFTRSELFGYQWLFNAQVVEMNVSLPDNQAGLLSGRNIAKYHQVTFNAGRTIYVLISPDGEEFVRISRDANRTNDVPEIPETWRIEERVLTEDLVIDLPNPTLNIRAENNQDSFQGPM